MAPAHALVLASCSLTVLRRHRRRRHSGCTNDSLQYFKSLRGKDYSLELQVTRAFAFAFLAFGLFKVRAALLGGR